MAEFKTSFIPKRPITQVREEKSSKGVNLVLFVSLILFLATLLVAGGVFVYQTLLDRQEQSLARSIDRAREAIEPELVGSLERIDSRIESTQQILDDHFAVSAVFDLLEQLTLESVSFDGLLFTVEPNGKIILKLSGVSRDYSSVALQSVIFGENRFIENPIFSDLQLDHRGNVSFGFSTNINEQLVLYKNVFTDLNLPGI